MSNFPKAYCVSCFEKKILKQSSSGGVFTIIAKYFISKLNGVVYGAEFKKDRVFHKRVAEISGIKSLSKSKYIQSDLGTSFRDCFADLNNGRYVFFVGTPCQIAGLMIFLKSKKVNCDRLLTADLFCHGVPKINFWKKYIEEKGIHSIIDIDFRFKSPSWENYSFKIFSKNKRLIEPIQNNEYFNAFLNNYSLMDACYNCKYKGENRLSDFSIGDFWGANVYYPELYNKNGTSLVIIRNKKDFLLDILSNCANVNEVNYNIALLFNPSYSKSVIRPGDYFEKISSIKDSGFLKTFKVTKNKITFFSKFKRNVSDFIWRLLFAKSNDKTDKYDTLIITDYGFTNFGNRLQNFALRRIIIGLGGKPANLFFEKKISFSVVY